MAVECSIEIDYPDEERAQNVARSISLDNDRYAETRLDGKRLMLKAQASSPASMLHTLEDLLSCLRVADAIMGDEGSELDALSDLDR